MRFVCLAVATAVSACASSAPTVDRAGGGTAREAPVRGGVLAGGGLSSADRSADVAAAQRASEQAARCRALGARVIGFEEEALLGLAISDEVAGTVPNRGLYLDAPGAPETERTELTRYLALLGRGLAAYSSRPAIPWTFLVLDADEVRSFSAPGGYVWVTTGLLRAVENEAQLAGVLAHEIGHVTLGHALEGWRKSQVSGCTAQAAARAVTGSSGRLLGAELGSADQRELAAAISGHPASSRLEAGLGPGWELDADASAVGLLLFAGYDVAQYTAFLDTLPPAATSPASRAARIEATRTREYAGFDFAGHKSPSLPACVTALRR